MWYFYDSVKQIEGVTVYGDFTKKERCPIVSLNVRDYDSSEVSDALATQYEILTRSGAHCAPLLHKALGTENQGAVRFSFAHLNSTEDVKVAIEAIKEIAEN